MDKEIDTQMIELSVPASASFIAVVEDCIAGMLHRIGQLEADAQTVYNIRLAVHETCINIMEHAYGHRVDGRIKFEFAVLEEPLQFVITMLDNGQPFDFEAVLEPDPENLQVRGYGLFLIQQLMDETVYTTLSNGNRWRLSKIL